MPRGKPQERKRLPLKTVTVVLTEAGYRCAVPTCRQILALDLHHIWQVSEGGPDEPYNLIALCPTCHALYHRGTISSDAIYAYKAMLVALSQAFDLDAIDRLLLLAGIPEDFLVISGDGVVGFGRLLVAGLARVTQKANNAWQLVTYTVNISDKGRALVAAWQRGDRSELATLLGATTGAAGEETADGEP